MLRRSLFLGSLALALVPGATFMAARAASDDPAGVSVEDIRKAIVSSTGYDDAAVELMANKVQLVVTLVNSKLGEGSAAQRENEAGRIVALIQRKTSGDPQFKEIQAIHVDYVSREANGTRSRVVDRIDFIRDPAGGFRHHIT